MSDSNTPQIPAGWYTDPSGAAGLRWWDGTQWTEHVSAPVTPTPAAEAPVEQAPVEVPPVEAPPVEAPVVPAAETPAAAPYVPPVEPVAPAAVVPPTAPVAPPAPSIPAAPLPRYGELQESQPQQYGQAAYGQAQPGQPQYGQPAYGSPAPQAAPAGSPVNTIFFWILAALPVLSLIGLLVWDMRAYIDASLYPDPSNPFAAFDGGYLLYSGIGWLVYAGTVVLAFFDNRQLKRIGIDRPFHWAWSFLSSIVYVIGRSVVLKRRGAKGFMLPVWVYIAIFAITFIIAIVKIADMIAYVVSVAPGYTGY